MIIVYFELFEQRFKSFWPLTAFYDEILTIKTTLLKLPKVSIEFEYELYNERDELLKKAYTKLVFVDTKTRLPMRCPDYFLDKLQN